MIPVIEQPFERLSESGADTPGPELKEDRPSVCRVPAREGLVLRRLTAAAEVLHKGQEEVP